MRKRAFIQHLAPEFGATIPSPSRDARHRSNAMLGWALTFLVIALVAAVFGFGGIASASAGIAQILFVIFLILFIVAMVARAMRGNAP
jgi:uncharacterized membrane protein YtjA (UPF0391 family)